jgi:hypothetical protein
MKTTLTSKPPRAKRKLEDLYELFASNRPVQGPAIQEEIDDLIAEVVAEDQERICRGGT